MGGTKFSSSYPDLVLEDHSDELASVLSAEPSRLIRLTVTVMAALLLSALTWSVLGKVDITVDVSGTVRPASEVRRVYAPVEGELVDLYVEEGMPVSEGDVLVRLDSRVAIKAASDAEQAQLALSQAEMAHKLFPARQRAAVLKLRAIQNKIAVEEKAHQDRMTQGMSKLSEEYRLRVEKARVKLHKARADLDTAERDLEKHRHIYQKGVISKKQLEDAISAHRAAEADYHLANAELGEAEGEFSRAYIEKDIQLDSSAIALLELRTEYQTQAAELAAAKREVESNLRIARVRATSASRITFSNIDEDNFLRILSPVGGFVTEVTYDNAGEVVATRTPILSIAPVDSRKIVQVAIPEKERGFLHEGMPVSVKFNAFPYQRYGVIAGTLTYISPGTMGIPRAQGFEIESSPQEVLAYKGFIDLERDHFMVGELKHPIRYGMSATAEIIVRQRRIVDLALDPMREITN